MESVIYLIIAIGVVFLLFHLMARFQSARLRGKPLPDVSALTDRDVAAMDRALFYFFQRSCHACKSMTPVIDELMQTRDNVFKVDATVHPSIARAFHIMGTPTTVVTNRGVIGEVRTGALSPLRLRSLLD